MTPRFKKGDKVEVIGGIVAVGERGVIDCRPAPEMRRYFDWCVEFPDGRNLGYRENDLNFATVPPEHRPLSAGALKAGSNR